MHPDFEIRWKKMDTVWDSGLKWSPKRWRKAIQFCLCYQVDEARKKFNRSTETFAQSLNVASGWCWQLTQTRQTTWSSIQNMWEVSRIIPEAISIPISLCSRSSAMFCSQVPEQCGGYQLDVQAGDYIFGIWFFWKWEPYSLNAALLSGDQKNSNNISWWQLNNCPSMKTRFVGSKTTFQGGWILCHDSNCHLISSALVCGGISGTNKLLELEWRRIEVISFVSRLCRDWT